MTTVQILKLRIDALLWPSIHTFVSETLSKSSYLIFSHGAWVKKVVFPFEDTSTECSWVMLVQFVYEPYFTCMIFSASITSLPLTSLLTPFIILPLVFLVSGLCWFIAAIGVFLKGCSKYHDDGNGSIIISQPCFLSNLHPTRACANYCDD